MVRKLIVLGIDGMDWDVIVRYKDKLPNLYGLMQKNNYLLFGRLSSQINGMVRTPRN